MAFLTPCWFIIESIVIPDGFLKWFYLSFYIHPFFLVFLQLFLWIKLLTRWILLVTFYPFRIIRFVALCVFRFSKNCFMYYFSSFSRVASVEVTEEADEKYSLVPLSCNRNEIIGSSHTFSSISPTPCKLILFEFQKNELVEDINLEEHAVLHEEEQMEELNSFSDNNTSLNDYVAFNIIFQSNSSAEDLDSVEELYSSSVCSSNSPTENQEMDEFPPSAPIISSSLVAETEVNIHPEDEYQESDAFYKKYTERMRWFDLLNYERTCGISAVMNKQLGTPSSFESSNEAVETSTPYISWSRQTKKKLLRSLESDFEMVYVAQSCLSWEALNHQYTKVKTLAESSSQNGVFYGNVIGEFQKFQVVLERFLEDERCEGKRIWNYVRGRFALKSLLQVPQIPGFWEEEKEDYVRGEATNVAEVLKAIERCIEAFGIFVRTEKKKSALWKLKNSLSWSYPPVEDPRELELLCNLNKNLRKKELWLKDLQGKQRCWFNRAVNLVEESQRKEILFTVIDMKLVSRVLQMSTLSSPQLKWCQEKLDNIEFKEGKVFRACSTGPLFPPS